MALDFTPAIRKAVDVLGGQSATARLLGVSQRAVWRWVHGQNPITPEHVLAVEAATGISRHDLRPDIYPPSDVSAVATGAERDESPELKGFAA